MSHEVDELRNLRWSESRLREEASSGHQLAGRQQRKIEGKLPESESLVHQLTQQIKELQHVVNSLQEAQEFNLYETASSSGPLHAPDQPSCFPSFPPSLVAPAAIFLNTRKVDIASRVVFEDHHLKASAPPASASAPSGSISAVARGNLMREN